MNTQRARPGSWRSRAAVAIVLVALSLAFVPVSSAAFMFYWWQRNMSPDTYGFDRTTAHNHTYNELYFGPNAGWKSEVWEVTPAGYRHFDKYCVGNCFNAHPGYYYDYVYCANRDGATHFVYDCRGDW